MLTTQCLREVRPKAVAYAMTWASVLKGEWQNLDLRPSFNLTIVGAESPVFLKRG
jgi:hypothetical protein